MRIRPGADVSGLRFFVYSKFVNFVMLSLSIVGVDCVMDAMVYLVTSIRQSM
jgi:hypothetical protein